MNIDRSGSISSEAELRRCAEEQLSVKSFEAASTRMYAETHQHLHELQIHQTELEMRNEELQRTQDELEASLARYFDLYEMGPIGYLTISEHGIVVKANPAAATMLGVARNALLEKPLSHFIFSEYQAAYSLHLKRAMKSNKGDAWDMRLRRSDGSTLWAHLQATPTLNGELWITFNNIDKLMESEIALRTSNNNLSIALTASKMGVWEWNVQTDTLLWSPECFQILGTEEVGGTFESFTKALYLDDGDRVKSVAMQALKEKTLFSVEYRLIHSDGKVCWLSSLAQPSYDENERPLRFIGTVQDITARKQSEEMQKATIEILRLSNIAEDSQELMRNLTLFFKNLTDCEAVGVRLRDGEDFPLYEARGFSEDFLLFENSRSECDQTDESFHDANSKPKLDCICGDIIRGLYDPSKPFFTTHGSFWSNSFTELQASSVGVEWQAGSCNRCNKEGYESIALLPLRSNGEIIGLFQFNDRRSGHFTVEKIAQIEELVDIVAISLAKIRSDEALRRSEQSLMEAQEIACLGSYVYNIPDDRWTSTTMLDNIFGIDGHFDQTAAGGENLIYPLQFAEIASDLKKTVEQRSTFDKEYRIVRKNDGAERWVHAWGKLEYDTTSSPIRMIGSLQDITARKQAEQAIIENVQMLQETRDGLIQFEKEAAVGRLVDGVAHELLNPVSIISSRLQFMEAQNLSDQDRDGLRICREQLKRVIKISQDLNHLSTIAPRPQVIGDLREVIALSLAMAEHRILEERICVVYCPAPTPIPVKMEKDVLLKAMNHIVFNACDALLQTEQKRLIISVQTPLATSKPAYARITIADNGSGIAYGDLNKIFDPFFTTKDPKKGTGLGLTICKNILATHSGKLTVENNDLGGASFIVELPLSYP